jgi:hypothetical protein
MSIPILTFFGEYLFTSVIGDSMLSHPTINKKIITDKKDFFIDKG